MEAGDVRSPSHIAPSHVAVMGLSARKTVTSVALACWSAQSQR